ncbi:hypothetical protein LguiA_033867 [Lonicera macranthoides]
MERHVDTNPFDPIILDPPLGGGVMVKKYILEGIEKLKDGGDLQERATVIRVDFHQVQSCLDDFGVLVRQKAASVRASCLDDFSVSVWQKAASVRACELSQ